MVPCSRMFPPLTMPPAPPAPRAPTPALAGLGAGGGAAGESPPRPRHDRDIRIFGEVVQARTGTEDVEPVAADEAARAAAGHAVAAGAGVIDAADRRDDALDDD